MSKSLSFFAGIAVGVVSLLSVWFFYPSKNSAMADARPEQRAMEQQQTVSFEREAEPASQASIDTPVDLPVQPESVQRSSQRSSQSTPAANAVEADVASSDQIQDEAQSNPAFNRDEQQFWDERDTKTEDVWGTDSSEHIADFFTQNSQLDMGFGSKLSDVECRATRCRVEVVHDNQRAQQDFAMKFAMGMSDQQIGRATMQSETTPDGHVVEVMYLSRQVPN